MVKRAKSKRRKGWEPPGFDVFKVEDLFPDERVQELADYLPHFESLAEVRTGILNAAGVYNALLHSDERPKGSEVRDALMSLLETIRGAEGAIDGLDYDAMKALERASANDEEDTLWKLLLPPLPPGFGLSNPGVPRVRHARAVLAHLKCWAEAAQKDTQPSSRGRPRHDAERDAIKMLAELWEAQSGQAPRPPYWDSYTDRRTRLEFLVFCRAVIWPILEHRQGGEGEVELPDLVKAVESVLRNDK